MPTAKGTFDIKGTPLPAESATEQVGAGRMAFNKTFHGDLEGTSVVDMLGLMDRERASGGYVALERFTGTLLGRKGSFCLQHSSTMTRGVAEQRITVIPDTGTDELQGLSGSMVIDIVEKQHRYTFGWALA
ncbi:MAG: DUF3224 domain-containing protein [Flavobacteriales bacterium]